MWVARHTHGKHRGEPRLWKRICSKLMNLVWLFHANQAHDGRVAQERILILILPRHCSDVLHGRNVLDLSKRNRSLRTDAEVAKYSTISTHMYYIFDTTGVPASATVPLDIERRIIYSG